MEDDDRPHASPADGGGDGADAADAADADADGSCLDSPCQGSLLSAPAIAARIRERGR